jgi:hypothetical protein
LWLLSHVSAETTDLVEDHLSHFLDILNNLEVEVKGRGASGFIGRIVPDSQVAMLKGFFNRDTGRGVEGKHAIQQV